MIFYLYSNPVLGSPKRVPREHHFQYALRDPPPAPPCAGKVPAQCRFHHVNKELCSTREKCGSAAQMIAICRQVPSGRRAMPPMKGSAGRAGVEWRRPDVGIDGTSLSRKRSRVVALLVPCVHPCRSASPHSHNGSRT